MQLDLSPLLRPSLYAPVPTTSIAAPFLDAAHQPPPDTDLDVLLSHRRFIHAADKATDILTSGSVSPSSTQQILELLYTRLSCLVIINQTPLAAKEAKPLVDLLARESATYPRPSREVFLSQVPWSLRLLLLKLQGLGPDVHRRTIMGLYALSTECRTLAAKAKSENDEAGFATWKSRLSDLGLRVAGELIEMGELETARRHLDTLSLAATTENKDEEAKMRIRKTLLLLKLGDVQAAEKSLSSASSSSTTDTDLTIQLQILHSLSTFHTSPSTTLSSLRTLSTTYPTNPLIQHNLAILNLYTNNVVHASEILEALVEKDEVVFPTLLFNLATVYELRTERARERKLDLVDLVVGLGDGDERKEGRGRGVGGFEKGVGEFKLT
jgi:hypothetical protein